MIFSKTVKYNTHLEIDEINRNLFVITEKFHTNSSDKFKFEGKITTNGFCISPTFNYGPNAQLRPEIIGTLTKKIHGTDIKLKFQLPNSVKSLLILALILNLGVITLMISFPDLTDFPFWDMWWLILIFLIVTILLFKAYFSFKVDKSERILKGIFEI